MGFLLVMFGIHGLLFCMVAFRDSKRRKVTGLTLPWHAYFWGLMFAGLFYIGIPLWWWRYGFRKMLEMLLICFGVVAATTMLLSMIRVHPSDDVVENLILGLIIGIPVRVIAGLWVARRDAEWRNEIVLTRKRRKNTKKEMASV
jgi:hypothetical protein